MEGLAAFQTPDVAALSAGIEVLALRQRLIANNLANVDTPGYRRVDVDFAQAFAAALADETNGWNGAVETRAVPAPAGTVADAVRRAEGLVFKNDGNGVDLDQEMVELAETGMQYEAASQMLALAFGRLKTAVTGRS